MEAILDHYHAKLAEQNMSAAEVIGEPNTNRHLERSSDYYICVLIMCLRLKMCLHTTVCVVILLYVSSTKNVW
jgi:hypothetical protein